nr:uncharacterized protein LOC107466147 [Ipomoea batatas]
MWEKSRAEAQAITLKNENAPLVSKTIDEVVSRDEDKDVQRPNKKNKAKAQAKVSIYKPQFPILKRLKAKEGRMQFDEFFQALKQWYFNIPFGYPEQVPQYAKSMKEFIMHNKAMVEVNVVLLGRNIFLEEEYGKESGTNVVFIDSKMLDLGLIDKELMVPDDLNGKVNGLWIQVLKTSKGFSLSPYSYVR